MLDESSFLGPDGKRYRLAKLRAEDQTQLRKWIRYRPYYDLLEQRDYLPADEYRAMSLALYNQCTLKSSLAIEQELDRAKGDPETTVYLIYLSLRRNHPDLTPNEVAALFTSNTVEEIARALNIANGLTGESLKKTPATRKKSPIT